MYVPAAFRPADAAVAREVMRAHPFATLVTATGGAPVATPLPFVLEGDTLYAHLARANPQARELEAGEVLVMFAGPHAYVSPRWYTRPAEEVPTWNYVAVHAYGRATVLGGADAVAVLERLVAQEEARFADPWRPDPGVLAELLPAIVAFRVDLTRVEAKLKLSQNRDPRDAAGARRGLAAGSPEEQAVAAWMERVGR